MEVKDIVPNLNRVVTYNGSEYKLKGSIIRKNENGEIFYQAEILDKSNNSVCIVSLKDIEQKEKNK
jgi:hypothetical protein